MFTQTIQTARLLLRPFERSDAPDVFAYASNPNVARYTSWETHRTLADSEAFIEMVLARGPHAHTWAIRLSGEPAVIGAIEFGPCDQPEAGIHFVLAEPFWNKGVMTEAAKAVLAWGVEHHPALRAVVSCAATENVGSQRVLEKCGLTCQRAQLHHWTKSAHPIEQRHYTLLRTSK